MKIWYSCYHQTSRVLCFAILSCTLRACVRCGGTDFVRMSNSAFFSRPISTFPRRKRQLQLPSRMLSRIRSHPDRPPSRPCDDAAAFLRAGPAVVDSIVARSSQPHVNLRARNVADVAESEINEGAVIDASKFVSHEPTTTTTPSCRGRPRL